MHTKIPARLLAIIVSSLMLTACGGGAGTPPPSGGANPPPANQAPTVAIGETGPVMELTSVTLTATAKDADGDPAYTWIQTSGTPVELTATNTAEITFTAPKVKNSEMLAFQVTMNDGEEIASASLDVIVEEANGVVYSGVEEVSNIDHVYFHHPAFKTPIRLSPAIETQAWLSDMQLAPDHKHVVYTLETGSEGSFPIRLFVAALDGSGARDLTGDTTVGGQVHAFKVSPDARWVAFSGDLETEGVEEIFVVPLDGSKPRRKMSGDIPDSVVAGGAHDHFQWSPDSTRVLFGGELRMNGRQEIFVASVSGSNPVLLSRDTTASNRSDLFRRAELGVAFAWSPNGEQIALLEQDVIDDPVKLTVVSADGAVKRDVITSNATTGNRIQMAWSAKGQLAFTAPIASGAARELYVDLPAGPEARAGALNIDDNNDGVADGRVIDFRWSPDGAYLAYTLERTIPEYTGGFVVPAGNNQSVRIDGMSDDDDSTAKLDNRSWLPGSNSVIFGRQVGDASRRLFSNNVEGNALVDLSGDFADDIHGVPADICLSPDGQTVIFKATLEGDGVQYVYRAGTAGGGRRAITGDVIADNPDTPGDVEKSTVDFVDGCWSPDGKYVLISGDLELDDLEQLFIVPSNSIDGRDRIRVSNLLETDDNANGTPDGVWRNAFWVGPDAE